MGNKIPVNESFDYLQKSLNNLNIQQTSTGSVPNLYPKVNNTQSDANPPQGATNTQKKPG